MIIAHLKENLENFKKLKKFKKPPPKKIVYRDCKNFHSYDLDQKLIQVKFYSHENCYDVFTETFKSIFDHRTPLKNKVVCGNDAYDVVNKHLRKGIINKSRCKHSVKNFPQEKTS